MIHIWLKAVCDGFGNVAQIPLKGTSKFLHPEMSELGGSFQHTPCSGCSHVSCCGFLHQPRGSAGSRFLSTLPGGCRLLQARSSAPPWGEPGPALGSGLGALRRLWVGQVAVAVGRLASKSLCPFPEAQRF